MTCARTKPTCQRSIAHMTTAQWVRALRVAGIGDPGVYLTDEVFLYRVAGVAPGEGVEMVELEDCYQLDLVRVPLTAYVLVGFGS